MLLDLQLFVYRVKRKGEITVPCGAPVLTVFVLVCLLVCSDATEQDFFRRVLEEQSERELEGGEQEAAYFTVWVRFVRKSVIQRDRWGLTFMECNLCASR